jgi:hypothetical protein
MDIRRAVDLSDSALHAVAWNLNPKKRGFMQICFMR